MRSRTTCARARARAPDARVWAVVKANAYGHGIERAFAGLRGADGFALLDLAEAERVRALGWRGPVLLLEGCFEPRDLELCSRLDLWHVVHREAQIDWLAAHKTQRPHRVFLKLNSGMNRLGFAPAAFRAAWPRLDALPQVDDDHADDALRRRRRRSAASPQQLAAFERGHARPARRTLAVQQRRDAAPRAPRRACAATGCARASCCYGSSPDFPAHDIAHWDLRPTMTLRAQLIATAAAATPATRVGYGSTFVADAPMRIGIVACGYADGYPRHCAAPARRCWSTACARAPSAACRWT